MSPRRKKDGLTDDEKKKVARETSDLFKAKWDQSKERRDMYRLYERWFQGDERVQWGSERPKYKPRVIANLIESNIRTKVSALTDAKPMAYIYGIPEADMLDAFEQYIQLVQRNPQQGQQQPEDIQRAAAFAMLTKDMNTAFWHFWRLNKMHVALEKTVYYGALTGLMVGRIIWNAHSYKRGELLYEYIHPKWIHFDETSPGLDMKNGMTSYFFYAKPYPLDWFAKYFGKELAGKIKTLGKRDIPDEFPRDDSIKYAWYIEGYFYDQSVEVMTDEFGKPLFDEEGEELKKLKYENGRRVMMGGDQLIDQGDYDFFPYAVQEYEISPDSPFGEGDVRKQIPLNKEYNSKLAQVSLNIALTANRQLIINPAKMGVDIDELQAHISDPGYVYQTKKLAEDIKNAIHVLEAPAFNPELFQYLYLLPVLLEQITGVVKGIMGMPQKRERQTRYEFGKQFEAATGRIRNTAHHVEQFIISLAHIFIEGVKKHYGSPRLIYDLDELTGTYNANIFEYPKEWMDLDFIVTVQPESILPIDMQSQAERDMQLAQMNMIDPQTLLETLRHPKAHLVTQRMQDMAMAMQQAQGVQGNTGPPNFGTPGGS